MILDERSLVNLIQAIVKATVDQGTAGARVNHTLSGHVDDIDEDLDVVYVRMDQEAMGSDPTLSDNYEAPGIIPATRLGETFREDQVRVDFSGKAGASASRTSTEARIVLPFGAEDGQRIILDGDTGVITLFNSQGELVGFIGSDVWAVGMLSPPARRLTLDPLGGIRMRAENDLLVTIIDQLGYTLRSAVTGNVTADLRHGSFRLVDPAGTDDIEMTTSTTGTLPNPKFESAPEATPGSSLVVPSASVFTSTPADDLELGHVVAWIRAVDQSATMTPPSGWTEQHDDVFDDPVGTLQTSVVTRQPATGTSGTFTSTESNWEHAIGCHAVLRGGGGTSPSFRSLSTATQITTADTTVAPIDKPTGVVEGDVLVAFVSLGVSGGLVPTGWTTPEGFVFLGANFSTSGSGSTQSTLSTGTWAKLAGPSEPSTYETTISLPDGTKMIHAVMVAVQDAFLVPGGVQIRMAGRPIRRLLDFTELQSDSSTLCDFQDIPASYDNLELVWDTVSAGGDATEARRLFVRFNGDSGNNYYHRNVEDGTPRAQGFQTNNLQLSGLDDGVGSKSSGSLQVYGYTTSPKPVAIGHAFWSDGLSLRNTQLAGQWDGAGGVSTIDRVVMSVTFGDLDFAAGSRAFLYGY